MIGGGSVRYQLPRVQQ